jgi:hypothetical protein
VRIGCLAWGSLFWDPRTLPHESPFREDGFPLPIEFSRVSLDGRVTLVIDESAAVLQTLWVPLSVSTLEEAVTRLGEREKVAPERRAEWIGRYQKGSPRKGSAGTDAAAPLADAASALFDGLDEWLAARGLDAVVWTALPARTPGGRLHDPGLDALLEHLASLRGEARERAEEYIRRTPIGIRTKRREVFERVLGWVPLAREAKSKEASEKARESTGDASG